MENERRKDTKSHFQLSILHFPFFMRILHILEATGGGTRRHVLDLLPQLQQRRVSCSLLYSPLRNPHFRDDAAQLHKHGIATHEIAMGHGYQRGGDATALTAVYAHLKTYEYDLIHCHSSNAGLLGRLANLLLPRPRPIIYTPHYIALAAGLPPLQRRAARWFEKFLAPHTTHYIAVSHHERSVFKRANLLRNDNATVIHNGVDVTAFETSRLESATRPTIGCFGRLTPQKNQQLLIRLLPLLQREFPAIQLRLVGDGENETALRELAHTLGCEEQIAFRTDQRDAWPNFGGCDVVALPSRWEGCSYALLEAMACGKAIVASNRGGNPEVLGKTGLLLPVHEPDQWHQAISQLLNDTHRRHELGTSARERVSQHFRLGIMVAKTLQVYQRVLS
jgi:glycosyltransferase involved in cell wall biosynthesis